MNVIVLGFLIRFTRWTFTVDHPASHRDSCPEDMSEKIRVIRMTHCIDAPFRQSEIDGLCEV